MKSGSQVQVQDTYISTYNLLTIYDNGKFVESGTRSGLSGKSGTKVTAGGGEAETKYSHRAEARHRNEDPAGIF